MMEDESGFLSNEDNKSKIKQLLSRVMKDLNEKRVSTIIEGETTIYLKIVKLQQDPCNVVDHQVPLLCTEFERMSIEMWDLTTQQVLPYINGINHVARIAAEADVENALVKACIQNLVYYGVVKLLPLLKYSNVYMCTRNLQNLSKNGVLAENCRTFVALQSDLNRPPLYKILQLYSSMTHGITLRTLCQRLCPRDNNIDERKIVTFGLEHNLIRCINKYPIFIGQYPIGRQKLYTGIQTLDEICVLTGLSPSKIEEEIILDTNVTMISK